MVAIENMNYGVRRNMSGVKPVAITLNPAVMVIGTWLGYVLETAAVLLPVLLSATFLLYWLGVVRCPWVRGAADEYARTLLATCDV